MSVCIVYNGFWNAVGPPAPVAALHAAAAAWGLDWPAVPHTALTAEFDDGVRVDGLPPDTHAAVFWDKDVRLARALEVAGLRLFNRADAVALCDDKAATHLCLARAGIPQPRTLVAPMTYDRLTTDGVRTFYDRAIAALGFPLVVKECFGSLGGQVYLVRSREELEALGATLAARPFLCQQYLTHCAGTDWRLYVVGGRVAAAMQRHNGADFRANVARGGCGEAYTPTSEETALALRCVALVGADFAAVDLLRDAAGRPLVCEVNSNAFFAELTACTGVDIAGEIVEYIQKEGT